MKTLISAYIEGSYFDQRPPAPRKVEMPLSAEKPAPVKATIWSEVETNFLSLEIVSFMT